MYLPCPSHIEVFAKILNGYEGMLDLVNYNDLGNNV